MKIFCLFIASLYTDQMRNNVDYLITSYQKICPSMLVREQNNNKNSLGKPMLFPRNLLYASQNKSKLFQSRRSLEGVKDMDTLVILVAASANLSSVLERQVNFLWLWLCNFNCCTL